MPGSGLGGFVEGMWGSVNQTRTENRQREIAQDENEAKALALLAEHGTPEFQSMALAAMLERAKPKSRMKGLRGFFGEMEGNPAMGQIQQLLNTPVQKTTTTPGLPSRGIPQDQTMRATPPPNAGGAAMASGSLVTGTPPPSPSGLPAVISADRLGRGDAPPAPPRDAFSERRGTPEVGRVDTEMVPRQPFLQPEERMRQTTIARERAEVEGRVAGDIAAGFTREQSLAMLKAERERQGRGLGRASGFQRQAVEVPDGQGGMTPMFAVFNPNDGRFYDPDTQQPLVDAVPVSRETRVGYGVANDAAARAVYGKPFGQLSQPEQHEVVSKWAPQFAKGMNLERGRGSGEAKIETAFNMPLTPDDAAQQGVAMGTTMAQVTGQVPQTPVMQDLRRNSAMLQEMLPHVKEVIRAALPSQQEIMGNLTPGLVMKARRLDPRYRNAIATMESTVNLLVNNIARVVGGAKGAQSEKDATRAEAAITNLKEGWITGDTAESAEARIDEAMTAIEAVIKTLPAEMVPGAPGVAPKPGQAAQPGAAAPVSTGVPGGTPKVAGTTFTDSRGTFLVKDPPYLPDGRLNVKRVAGPAAPKK